MKAKSSSRLPFWLLFFLLAYLSACVQPYSSKSFYKVQNIPNTDLNSTPSEADEAGQLSYADIAAVSKLRDKSEKEISKALKKLNPNWHVKGYDLATGELFFFNSSSKNSREAFIWHSKENIAEYVTTNTGHYLAIVNSLKASGYTLTGNSIGNGENYSNGNKNIVITKVLLFDNSSGFKILFKN